MDTTITLPDGYTYYQHVWSDADKYTLRIAEFRCEATVMVSNNYLSLCVQFG